MWKQGKLNGYDYWLKSWEQPSHFGIDNGRISKLSIRQNGTELYNFDRGLDFDELDDDGRITYKQLLAKYN
jgi:hypothetical protein